MQYDIISVRFDIILVEYDNFSKNIDFKLKMFDEKALRKVKLLLLFVIIVIWFVKTFYIFDDLGKEASKV